MTLEPRPIVATLDTHPRRPAVLCLICRHWRCCCVWRVSAGSCSSDGIAGSGQNATTFEDASAELIDFSTAFNALAPRLQRVLHIVIEHGLVDKVGGDPLRGHLYFDDSEVFWTAYSHRLNLGVGDWYKAQEMQDLALDRMARSLGWRPVEQVS